VNTNFLQLGSEKIYSNSFKKLTKIMKKNLKKIYFNPLMKIQKRTNKKKKFKNYIYNNVTKTKNKAKKIIFLLCLKWVEIYCIYDFLFFIIFFALFFLIFS
jgi:hypothetical protein